MESAERTAFPLGFVNVTGALRHARVDLLVLDGAFEEALAGLAGEKPVVVATHFVPAHGAQLLDDILGVRLVAGLARRGGHVGTALGAACEQVGRVQVRHVVHLVLRRVLLQAALVGQARQRVLRRRGPTRLARSEGGHVQGHQRGLLLHVYYHHSHCYT